MMLISQHDRAHATLRAFTNPYVFSVLSKFTSVFVGLLQSVVIARYLGAALKGDLAYIQSVTSIGQIVVTFGMHQAYPFYRRKYGKNAIIRDFLTIMVYLYILLLLVSIGIAFLLDTSLEIKIIVVLIPVMGYTYVTGYIVLIERPNLYNFLSSAVIALSAGYVALLWAFAGKNLYWVASILLVAELFRCVAFTYSLHIVPKIHIGLTALLVDLVKFGFFPMVALLLTTLNYRIDIVMLRQFDNVTSAMIGVYSLGISLSDRIALIPDSLKGVLVSRLAAGADGEEVAKVCRIGFWSSCLLCLCIGVFGPPVIDIMYGAEYTGAYSVILITAAGMLAISYFKFISQYNIVNGKQVLNAGMLSIAVVVDVVLNLALVPRWGIDGAALATSVGNLVCGVVFVCYFSRTTGIFPTKLVFIQQSDIDYVKRVYLSTRPKSSQ